MTIHSKMRPPLGLKKQTLDRLSANPLLSVGDLQMALRDYKAAGGQDLEVLVACLKSQNLIWSFGGVCHTDCNLWQAWTALARKPIRGEPGAGSILLNVLTQSHINSVVILGYIPINVIEPAITELVHPLLGQTAYQEI